MSKILENFFNDYYIIEKTNSEVIKKLEAEIEKNEQRLKVNLSRKQKKLLLRIVDAKGLISEESNQESFIAGFKLGLKVGYESNKD